VDRGAKRIAVITHGGRNDAFWDVVEDGVERAAQNLAVDVKYITPEGLDYERMRSLILEAVGDGIDGLIVSMPNREILWGAVQEAIDSGIPVVAINSCDSCLTAPDGSPTGILAWFGSDDVAAGELACQQFRERGISKVLAIDGESGNSALLDRVKGCNEVPGINATRVFASKNDIQLQRAVIDDALAQSGPDTGVLTLGPFGFNSVPQNVTDWVMFDFSAKAAELMVEGRIQAAIDQQQYLQGYLSVNYMVNLLAYGQRVLKRKILTGPDLISTSRIRSRECKSGGVWFEGEPPPKQKGVYLPPRNADQEKKCPAIDRNEYSITMVTTGTDASPYWRQIKNGAEVAAQDIGVKLDFKQDRQETGLGLSELFSPAEVAEIAGTLGPKHGLIISTSSLTYPKQSQSKDSPESETKFLASLNLTSDRPVLIYGVGGETGILEIGKRGPFWREVEGGRVEGLGPVLLVGGLRDDTVEITSDLLLSAARMKDRADEVCTRGTLCMDPRLGTDKELLQMCNATADSLSGQCKALNVSSEALSATEAPFDGSSKNSVLAKRDELLRLTSQMEFGTVLALGPNGWQPDVITLGPTATSVFGFDGDVYGSLVGEVGGLELDFATQNQPFIAAYWAVLSMALALMTDQTLAVNNILDTGPFVLWNARDPNDVQRFTTKPDPEKALQFMRCSLGGLATCNPAFAKKEGITKGALSGIIVGTWVAIAVVVGGVAYFISKRRARRLRREAENWRVNYSELEGMENAELLGEGGFGRVVKARFRGSEVAVKSIWTQPSLKASSHAGVARTGSNWGGEAAMEFLGMRSSGKARSDKKSRKMVDKELRTMAKMRHPNILGLMAATVHPRTREVLLISELMARGSMQMLIDQNAPLDMVTLLTGLFDVARGMNFLHSSNVVHGDIKPANILVDDTYHCKLGDFGFSRELGAVAFGGTPEYMAPECLHNPLNQTPASDMYSFAISVWQIVSRGRPFGSRLRSGSLESASLQGSESQNVADFLSGMGKIVRDRVAAVKAAHDEGERPDLAAMKRARRDCPDALIGLVEESWQTTPGDRPSFEQIALRLEAILAKEREKSREQNQDQDLLYRMMPPRVAEQLKAGQRVEAENFDSVTIFFSDVCGYTELSSSLPPQEVMAMMDRLFSAMDALSTKYGLFKVETIGDAYFCVGNLEPPQENHAAQVLRFAKEVVAAVSGMPLDPKDPRKGCFKIRIGIHTGAVLGSVVGDLNPRYCLFGDAVNTASRMESTSKPLAIHLSPQAYAALAQQDRQLASTCTRRGVISVKGKGRMVTYWGQSAESGASPTDSPRATSSPEASQPGMDSAAALNTFFLQHRLPKPAARELLVLLAAPEFSLEEVARQGEDALLGGLRGV
jgi:class 3 adenylate cyclase/ABC-type sugar transport system substrate-binding protein